jgi:hypothetical protein
MGAAMALGSGIPMLFGLAMTAIAGGDMPIA